MTDKIIISRLAVVARHGVLAEEAQLGQRFYVSLTCMLDLRPAGSTDDYGKAVNYGAIAETAYEVATTRRFKLIEGLAEAIAARLLERFARLDAVTVKVEKPSAPVPLIFDTIAVEIERRRDG